MAKEKAIDLLRRGERVLCPVCKKHFFDVSDENREHSNYFHCEDENCKGYIHEQKAINID